jgi:hypothetical protein
LYFCIGIAFFDQLVLQSYGGLVGKLSVDDCSRFDFNRAPLPGRLELDATQIVARPLCQTEDELGSVRLFGKFDSDVIKPATSPKPAYIAGDAFPVESVSNLRLETDRPLCPLDT